MSEPAARRRRSESARVPVPVAVSTNQPSFIPLPEAAREFGVSVPTALKWMKDGEFPQSVRIGGRHYLGREVWRQWLAQTLERATR